MDEKKTYPVTGTVTISSEEYRDLIVAAVTEAKSAESWMRSKWEVDSKLSAAEKEKEKLKYEAEGYRRFLANCTEAAALYRAFLAEERLKEVTE